MPKNATAKYSGALNFRAAFAIAGEDIDRKIAPMSPPTPEAMVAMPIAFPARPCWAIG